MCRLRSVAARMLLLALVSGVIAASAPDRALAERTLALSSGSFSFEIVPGEQVTGEVVVINDGDEPIKVLVYSADQDFDETGEVSYSVPNRSDPGFAQRPTSWVRLQIPAEAKSVGNTPYLELEPQERVPVEFLVQPPVNASPGDHNVVLFFEMFEFSDEAGGVVSQVTGRIGSRLQMRVEGPWIERLAVQPFIVPWMRIGSEIPYELTIGNTGNLDQRLSAAVVLLDRNRVELARDEPLLATLVFASTNRLIDGTVASGKQLVGRYTLQAEVYRVDEEGRIDETVDPIVEQRQIWLVPPWLLIALGVLVGAVLLRVLTAAARRRQEEKRARRSRRSERRRREESDVDPDRPGMREEIED